MLLRLVSCQYGGRASGNPSPDLTLHTSEFSKPWIFAEFVSGIVTCRKGHHPLRTLDFDRHGYMQPQILTDLINYALLHSVQNLKIYVPYNLGLPYCVFSCHSLTCLDISVSMYDIKRRTRVPKYLDLPALRSFRLEGVGISADNNGHAEPFSTMNKLNTLSIDNCVLIYPNPLSPEVLGILNITNATLANLTISDTLGLNYKTKIPDPGSHKYVISTPKLSSFTLNGSPFQTAAVPEWAEIELQSSSLP